MAQLGEGDKARISLSEIWGNLYADIEIKRKSGSLVVEARVFEGDRVGSQYGVAVEITPEIETLVAEKIEKLGVKPAAITIAGDKDNLGPNIPFYR